MLAGFVSLLLQLLALSRQLSLFRLAIVPTVVVGVIVLEGCAAPLPHVQRTVSQSMPPVADSPLQQLVSASGVPDGKSGFWPLPQGAYALDARLALLRQAKHSLDLQYYLLADDSVGRTVMRELRDASARGVRVRLLVDDFYTKDVEPGLRALQTYPNVEVRIFNPFVLGRESGSGRVLNLMGDFRRLNHRMHNKLFVADGALAIVGGRNLADEYFLRGKQANFLDMDVLIAGKLVGQIGSLFDRYWNSEQVYPIEALDPPTTPVSELRARFAERVEDQALTPRIEPLSTTDMIGEPPVNRALDLGRQRFVIADAQAVADLPSKARAAGEDVSFSETLTYHYLRTLNRAQTEVLILSPYFVPGRKGVERLREARDRGVEVRVVTNTMGASDEPLVNLGYHNYREELLEMGVQLFELSSARTDADESLKTVLKSSRGILHAKMAFVDRRIVLFGSMNVDLRSTYSNTEIGVGVESPELAKLILDAYRADTFPGVYQVQLKPDRSGVQWVARGGNGEEVLVDEPEIDLFQRFKLWFQFLFVPEDLL